MTPDRRTPADTGPRPRAPRVTPLSTDVLRFSPGERYLHWALAVPFVLLYVSAGVLIALYGEAPPRAWRHAFSYIHRAFGVMLIVLPPLALVYGSPDWRQHLRNMREGWRWMAADIRWLMMFPLNAVNSKIALPEQGKFNAAEKLNFMMVSTFYPLYIVTGILVWLPGDSMVFFLAHYAMAVTGLALVMGHIFMATLAPSTKVGLSGMFTGWVDRGWAKHHYRRWYREQFERKKVSSDLSVRLRHAAPVRCAACKQVQPFPSWSHVITQLFQVGPLVCPQCQTPIRLVASGDPYEASDAILKHLQTAGGEARPFEAQRTGVA